MTSVLAISEPSSAWPIPLSRRRSTSTPLRDADGLDWSQPRCLFCEHLGRLTWQKSDQVSSTVFWIGDPVHSKVFDTLMRMDAVDLADLPRLERSTKELVKSLRKSKVKAWKKNATSWLGKLLANTFGAWYSR